MYLWTFSSPNRDGDLDSDIVWHEYGHGLTWRMIGSMSGPLSGAIGEGMSDVLAIYTNRNDVVGEYSYNNAGGIRRYPYTNYPLTYGDVTGSSVHNDGEIYAATMWKLLELWEDAGLTQDELFDYVVGVGRWSLRVQAYAFLGRLRGIQKEGTGFVFFEQALEICRMSQCSPALVAQVHREYAVYLNRTGEVETARAHQLRSRVRLDPPGERAGRRPNPTAGRTAPAGRPDPRPCRRCMGA